MTEKPPIDPPVTLEDCIGMALHAGGLPFDLDAYLKVTREIRERNDEYSNRPLFGRKRKGGT